MYQIKTSFGVFTTVETFQQAQDIFDIISPLTEGVEIIKL